MLRRHRAEHPWPAYLARFHADRPGITEAILGRCRSDGVDPYDWVAEPLRHGRATLDVASGSGPLAGRAPGWVGVDAAPEELRAGIAAGRRSVVLGRADALPFRGGAVDSAVCAMSLQIIEPVGGTLAEMARVLRDGGAAALLLPAASPMPMRQLLVYLKLQLLLRARIRYPNDRQLTRGRLARAAEVRGLRVVADERRAFHLPIETAEHAAELVRSLYLPGVPAHRLERASRHLAGRVGTTLTVPLRRVILEPTWRRGLMAPPTEG